MDIDQIYRDYANLVFKYLMCLCHDPDLSEELTQETFYQAIRSVHKYDGTCKVSTWLCQIAKHLWYHELDRRKHKSALPLEHADTKGTANVEETAILRQEKMDLFKQIHLLSEIEKEIVFLRLTGELSFLEIGEIFEKNESWARVTFYRAKQKLKGATKK